MILTPEQRAIGRRNFMKALAGTPALADARRGVGGDGPVQGGKFASVSSAWAARDGRCSATSRSGSAEVKAIADVQAGRRSRRRTTSSRSEAAVRETLHRMQGHAGARGDRGGHRGAVRSGRTPMSSPPVWTRGKHVLCEKMMGAGRATAATRMIDAASKTNRVLEIGYQRNYNPVYRAAYEGVIKTGRARRRVSDAPGVGTATATGAAPRRPVERYDPSQWGYPTWEHLGNWRLYWRDSEGSSRSWAATRSTPPTGSSGTTPERVQAMGGVYRFKDGREVPDHVLATFEYPGGVTGTFSSVESNAFDERYEAFFGTKGTLIMLNENEALLFDEGGSGSRHRRRSARRRGRARCSRRRRRSRPRRRRRERTSARRPRQAARARSHRARYSKQSFLPAHPLRHAAQRAAPERASHSASWTIAAKRP